MSKVTVSLSPDQRINIALSILGWSRDTFDDLLKNNTLELEINKNINKKLVSIPRDNNVGMNYSEQWAYGVLLASYNLC